MMDVRISEVRMTNNNTERGSIQARRKPVESMARKRKLVSTTLEDTSVMVKRREIVINRPGSSGVRKDMFSSNMRRGQMRISEKSRYDSVRSERTGQVVLPKSDSMVIQPRMIATNKQRESTRRPTAQELKEQAISQVLTKAAETRAPKKRKMAPVHFGFKRVLLATFCAAVAVFAIVYFVNLNAPNISLKVAAMQSGIEASYPAYVPREYTLSDIASENGKITLNFKSAASSGAFTLVEEKSSWDSNALLNNYIREEYGENYTLIREQGLALYISNSDAAWVNGGVVYKLKTTSGSLTKKQIKSIAVSL